MLLNSIVLNITCVMLNIMSDNSVEHNNVYIIFIVRYILHIGIYSLSQHKVCDDLNILSFTSNFAPLNAE